MIQLFFEQRFSYVSRNPVEIIGDVTDRNGDVRQEVICTRSRFGSDGILCIRAIHGPDGREQSYDWRPDRPEWQEMGSGEPAAPDVAAELATAVEAHP